MIGTPLKFFGNHQNDRSFWWEKQTFTKSHPDAIIALQFCNAIIASQCDNRINLFPRCDYRIAVALYCILM
mgnify:CR=1 FL=1